MLDQLDSPRKPPRCVWVFPTSIASSIACRVFSVGSRHGRHPLRDPGSHPSRTARRMLELKGIDYKRRDLIPVVSKGALRAVGFPGNTVPALKIDGEKVQGSREIARELDRLRPTRRCSRPIPPRAPGRGGRGARATRTSRPPPGGSSGTPAGATARRWRATPRAPARRPDRLRGEDRRRRSSRSRHASTRRPTSTSGRTSPPCRGCSQRVDDWIAAGVLGGDEPTPPTTRSRPRPPDDDPRRPSRPSRRARPASWRCGSTRITRADAGDPAAGAGSSRWRRASGLASGPTRTTRSPATAAGRRPAASRRGARGRGRARAAARARTACSRPAGAEASAALSRISRSPSSSTSMSSGRGAWRAPPRLAAALGLDPLAGVEQPLGLQRGADLDRGVEEVGLVEHFAVGLGLIGGRDGVDLDPARGRAPRRPPADCRRGRRRWSRAPGSRRGRMALRAPRPESFVDLLVVDHARAPTSTATSSIDSGSGGSGLAARTWTERAPKRSISRSLITWPSRSSVL